MTNGVQTIQDKTEQIRQAIAVIEGLDFQPQLSVAKTLLVKFQQEQSEGNKEDAVRALLYLANTLTSLSTEVRVVRGGLLRP